MVSFGQALIVCLKSKIFNCKDRAPRSEFWWFMLGAWLINIVLAILNIIPILGQIIYLLGSIWLFIATITVSVRRMHDLNKSGWWLLFPYVALFSGIIIASVGSVMDTQSILLIGGFVTAFGSISILVLLIFMILRGTVGVNRYGSDPLGDNTVIINP